MARGWLILVLGVSACTRGNPAFGEGTAGSAADDESSAATTRTTSDSDPSDPSPTGSVDSAETSATSPPLDTGDDVQDPTETTDPTDPETSTTGSTRTCEIGKPPVFDILVHDADANPLDPQCGNVTQIAGPVAPGEAPNEMVMTVCVNDTCDCADGDEVRITFTDLVPSPVDAIDNADNACVSLTWARAADDDSCRVTWLSMETQVMSAQHPRFMAANVAMPQWGHVMPPAEVGPSIERCDEEACGSNRPGFYTLMLGNFGPLEPGGDPVATQFDPFTNGEAPYDVYAQFAQVQNDCSVNVGWAAIETDG